MVDSNRRKLVLGAAVTSTVALNRDTPMTNEKLLEHEPFAEKFLFRSGDITHPVYWSGDGPGVLLMHEMPGMVPEFWRLANWIKDAGFSVFTPDLFASSLDEEFRPSLSGGLSRACISREIHLFARNSSSPLTVWLRALAAKIHEDIGGSGVGVIGLCMTGNFALSLVLEDAVIAPVASEPAMPVDFWTRAGRHSLHLSKEEERALKARTEVDVMGLRFKGDPTCTVHRFDAIEALIGKERFKRIELDDHHKNPAGNSFPHAVLTKDLIDETGSATLEAKDKVIEFLHEKLGSEQGVLEAQNEQGAV